MHPVDKAQVLAASLPFDPAHLATQTDGDLLLQRDLLNLFVVQSAELMAAMRIADPHAAGGLAHKLSGSARAIGAFELAGVAAKLESMPAGEEWQSALQFALAALGRALGSIEAYLGDISSPAIR
jgi:HPt (histidine-containing phosphotransfer) domain-containing protein